MKKLLILAVLLAFTGCSGGSEGTGNGASPELSADPLVGAWLYSGPSTSSTGGEANFIMNVLFNFGADGTFDVYLLLEQNSTEYLSKCSSTYSTSGNQLTINAGKCDDGNITQTTTTYSVSGDQLTISSDGEGGTLTKWAGNVNELHAATSVPSSPTLPLSSAGGSTAQTSSGTPTTPTVSKNIGHPSFNFWVWSND